jgi:hypothetical protein
MGTAATGNATEAAVLTALAGLELTVLIPFGDGEAFDLVAYLGEGKFLRVQCKTARERNGVILFNSRSTDHGRGRGEYTGLADAFGVYAPCTDSVYLVPVAQVSTYVHTLRLEQPRNNQRRRIRYAADFRIDRWSVPRLRSIVEPDVLGHVSVAPS